MTRRFEFLIEHCCQHGATSAAISNRRDTISDFQGVVEACALLLATLLLAELSCARQATSHGSPRVSLTAAFGSLTVLLHQRCSALADLLKRHFEVVDLLGAQFREHSLHLPGMFSEG
jgi:hypothetical protein